MKKRREEKEYQEEGQKKEDDDRVLNEDKIRQMVDDDRERLEGRR